jgi:ABC-type multidrug transport system fused ATPase/permease subunit
MRRGARLVALLVRMHPAAFALAVTGAALFVSAIVAAAVVIGNVTDSLIVPVLDEGASTAGRLWPGLLAVIAVATWKAAGITLRRTAAGYLQFRAKADVRNRLIDHLLRLELGWYSRQSTGDLLAVTDSDANQGTFILAPLPYGTGATLLLIGSVVMILFIDPVMALAALVILVSVVATDLRGSWRTQAQFARVQEQQGDVAAMAHESFDGALTVKALGREAYETRRLAAASDELRDTIITVDTRWNTFRVAVEGILSISSVVLLMLGAWRIQAGAISPGDLITIVYLITLLYIPVRLIGFVIWDLTHSVAGWERVEAVLEVRDVVPYGSLSATVQAHGAEVGSETLDFSYTGDDLVLEGVELTIEPGRVVAVVGPTGSGKSTLAVLLARLWDPMAGAIRIDGRDLRDFARSALPGEVAFVAQEAFLFDDTVRGNIGFGVHASDADIEAAARLANAHEFVGALPHGYETVLGERGTTLSGGQRQRIALARAVVRKPRLLILDDATSAVDPSVETRILEGLRRAELPSTIVVVAYRQSSILLADEIVYVEDGRIVAHGHHDELLATVPGYAEILDAYDADARRRAEEAR